MIAETRSASQARYASLRTDDVYILRSKLFRDRIRKIRFGCGHRDHRDFEINLFGRIVRRSDDNQRQCGDCMAQRMKQDCTRCVRCGAPIFDQEFVTYYDATEATDLPSHTRILIPVNHRPDIEIPHLILGCGDAFCMPRGTIAMGQLREGLVCPFDEQMLPFRTPLLTHWTQTPYIFPLVTSTQSEVT